MSDCPYSIYNTDSIFVMKEKLFRNIVGYLTTTSMFEPFFNVLKFMYSLNAD